jgi:hypothetical protein
MTILVPSRGPWQLLAWTELGLSTNASSLFALPVRSTPDSVRHVHLQHFVSLFFVELTLR